jgi:hypothetical protein
MQMRTYTPLAARREKAAVRAAFWQGFWFALGLAGLAATLAVYKIATLNIGA